MTVCEECGRELEHIDAEHTALGWNPWRHVDLDKWAANPHEAQPAPTLPFDQDGERS